MSQGLISFWLILPIRSGIAVEIGDRGCSKSNKPEPEVKTNSVEVVAQECLVDTIPVADSITDTQKPQRLIVVNVPQVKPYERVVTSRDVTFTCKQCIQTVIQERMPGPLPSYCSDRCRGNAAANRKRASRATTGKNKGTRGRPKKINS